MRVLLQIQKVQNLISISCDFGIEHIPKAFVLLILLSFGSCEDATKSHFSSNASGNLNSSSIPSFEIIYYEATGCWQRLLVNGLCEVEYNKGIGGEIADSSFRNFVMSRAIHDIQDRSFFLEELDGIIMSAKGKVDTVNRPYDSARNLINFDGNRVIDVYGGKSPTFNKLLKLVTQFAALEIDYECLNK